MGAPEMRSPASRGDADRAGNCLKLAAIDEAENTPFGADLQQHRAAWLARRYRLHPSFARLLVGLAFDGGCQ